MPTAAGDTARGRYVIGVHDGHNASAAIIKDGVLQFAVQEERLVGKKNFYGFPARSIEACLDFAKVSPSEVAQLALATMRQTPGRHRSHDQLAATRRGASVPGFLRRLLLWYPVYRLNENLGWKERQASAAALGFSVEQCRRYDHHLGHAATAYFGMREDPTTRYLVVTMDGLGDLTCCSVFVAEGGTLEQIARTPFTDSLGTVYAYTTGALGFVPQEHEYKLMGMAPYASAEDAEHAADQFGRLIGVDEEGLRLRRGTPEPTFCQQRRLAGIIEGMRFDKVCAGVQLACERVVVRLVRAAIRRTGIRRLLCAGGVFMNVKANKLLMELPDVDYLGIPPSCGDESLSMGVAWYAHSRSGGRSAADEITPFESPYLGPDVAEAEAEAVVRASGHPYSRPRALDVEVAKLLLAGHPVACCTGRIEFGARALGDRSILAGPKDQDIVRVINQMIKKRDFWMPFAPVVRLERMHEYIHNPKGFASPYMMLAFDTKENFRDLIAAVHNADLTARMQTLEETADTGLCRVLTAFERLSGRGVLLNTSFNQHGHPIALGPREAMSVFDNSGLTHLVVGPYLVRKREAASA